MATMDRKRRACPNPRSSLTSSCASVAKLQRPLKMLEQHLIVPVSGEETMGRVYDALKRAESAQRHNHKSFSVPRNGDSDNVSLFTPSEQEHPWSASPFTAMPAVIDSAPTAHTAEETGGPALPGGPASRDAGATLGAVGSARAVRFSSQDVLAARVEPHLVAITAPRSPECEQFRALRTRLLEAGERKRMRAFVITSPGVGEGKTLTALNLGWLMAQTDGVKALLIDADLRQPCAAEYLGIETDCGLSEVLTGETRLTEANLLINRADAALLVVRASKTRYAIVDRLLEQLPRERILGVVLNRAEIQPDDTAYYYRSHYQRQAPPVEVSAEAAAHAADATEQPEMIYIEEGFVS